MRKTKMTATELARRLGGLHVATVYRLRKLPGAPPIDEDHVADWKDFAIMNCMSPKAIVKLCS